MSYNLLNIFGIIPSEQITGFSPIQIGDLKLWLDADDASTITETASAISQWDDKSSNSNHAIQGVGSSQPTYSIAAHNGLNAVSNLGVDYLNLNLVYGAQNSVFIVATAKQTAGGSYIMAGSNAGNKPSFLSRYADKDYEFFGASPRFTYSDTGATGVNVLELVHTDGGSTNGYYNGVSGYGAISGLVMSNQVINMLFSYSGSAAFFTGDICEVLIYHKAVSTLERQQIETYLINKWLPVPKQIPNITTWFDAADASTITQTANAVSQWDDKSGKAFNAIQGVGSNQPTTGTRTINGLNVIDFDGTSDFLTLSDEVYHVPHSSFIVMVADDIISLQVIMGRIIGGGANGDIDIFVNASTFTHFVSGSSGEGKAISSNITASTPFMGYTSAANGEKTKLSIDQETDIESPGTVTGFLNSTPGRPTAIGRRPDFNSNHFNGTIGEIIHYDRVLSGEERAKVETYLSNKWGI